MFDDTTLGPRLRTRERLLLIAARIHQRGELVEREDDVGAELMLDLHRYLGCEPVFRTVDVGLERDAVIVDARETFLARSYDVVGLQRVRIHGQRLLETGAEAQHLESTRIGERRSRPVHECAEAAGGVDDVGAGLEVEVVGVGQQGLRTEVGHGLGQHRFDRGAGADRDERGGMDVAVRRGDDARACERAA